MRHACKILHMKFEMFVIIIKENLLSNENLIQVSCQKLCHRLTKYYFSFSAQMKCVQHFEMESSEELGEIPSSANIIEIEDESLNDENFEKCKMSEHLRDNCNFELSEVNLTDKKQDLTDKIEQDYQEDSIDVENVSQNDEKLNSHRATENSNDFCNLYQTNLTDEKQEITEMIEHDYQGDNEISIHYFCSMCPASFDKKSSLFQHFTVKHEKPTTRKWNCYTCNSHFRSESKLKRHMEIFHEKSNPSKSKPHGCKECKGTYKTKPSLKKHIKNVHQNLTQFSCGECKATFGLKQNMKQHIRIVHEKVKSFECQVCDATFGTRSNLQNHNKSIHQKSEPLGYQEFSLD